VAGADGGERDPAASADGGARRPPSVLRRMGAAAALRARFTATARAAARPVVGELDRPGAGADEAARPAAGPVAGLPAGRQADPFCLLPGPADRLAGRPARGARRRAAAARRRQLPLGG